MHLIALCTVATLSFLAGTAEAQQPATAQASQNGAILKPLIDEEFSRPWQSSISPNGIWRIAGPWKGTGGNLLDPQNARISTTYKDASGGFLLLTSKAKALIGAEVQSLSTQAFGYYESRLRVTDVPGVCVSFFWIQAPNYGPLEIDVEFLTNEPWITSENSGQVHFYIHPAEQTYVADLPFNPAKEFHAYGFLWTSGQVAFTVDNKIVKTFSDDSLKNPVGGFVMMNSWTGNKDWGGGPPARDATSAYDWVKYYPSATSVPSAAPSNR